MKFSRMILLSLFITLNINNTIQAHWSFSNLTQNIQKKIEETFTNHWRYALTGLFLIPACLGAFVYTQRYLANKNVINKNKPDEKKEEQESRKLSSDRQFPPSSSVEIQPDTIKEEKKENQPKQEKQEEEQEINTVSQDSPATTERRLSDSNLVDSRGSNLTDSVVSIPTLAESGQNYFLQIQAGTFNIPQKENEHLGIINSLIHYFYKLADQKNQKFDAGTFIIEDPEHKIFDTMFTYVKRIYGDNGLYVESPTPKTCSAYPRPSSHLEKYYFYTNKTVKQTGWLTNGDVKKPEYTHYGIDVYGNEKLPIEGMHHILFGKVDENRTFIRMEPHGLQTTDYVHHSFGFINSTGRKIAPGYFGSDDGKNMRKERVPKDILNKFKALIKELNLENIQELAKKAEALGISFMVETLNGNTDRQAKGFINEIKEQYDNVDTRIGREVILTQNEFTSSFK